MNDIEKTVVTLEYPKPHVAQITMADTQNKNMFSPAIITGLTKAFSEIERNLNIKAVVLTGYGNYFSTGGTKEELFALQAGNMVFTDIDIYRLCLDCPVPVLSAMQGHGVGGGLVLGLFSDIIVFAKESVYKFNFMNYGFTPGMGATFIAPYRMGYSIAHEMLMLGKNYRGGDLQARGLPFDVVPRKDVLSHALSLASELAEKPRKSLVILKQHMTRDIVKNLPSVIDSEKEMHALTFHSPEVKARIAEII